MPSGAKAGKKCFGPTQGENFVWGILLLLAGLTLLCTPLLLCFACVGTLNKITSRVNG